MEIELKDLLAFQKSKWYKALIKKCGNRKKALQENLMEAYRTETDEVKLNKNMHHHFLAIAAVFRKVIEELDDESKGAVAFTGELAADIEQYEDGIISRVTNSHGIAYTALQITTTDLERSKIIAYMIVEELLGWMIKGAEKEKEPVEEGAF